MPMQCMEKMKGNKMAGAHTHSIGMDGILRVHREWWNVIKILRRIIMFIAACMHACPQIYVFFSGDMFARHP